MQSTTSTSGPNSLCPHVSPCANQPLEEWSGCHRTPPWLCVCTLLCPAIRHLHQDIVWPGWYQPPINLVNTDWNILSSQWGQIDSVSFWLKSSQYHPILHCIACTLKLMLLLKHKVTNGPQKRENEPFNYTLNACNQWKSWVWKWIISLTKVLCSTNNTINIQKFFVKI